MTPKLRGRPLLMNKLYDDSNWREEYKSYTSNERHLELLENGPKSLSQSWILQALYNEWKKIKGYNKLDPEENEGQLQSSMSEFFKKQIVMKIDTQGMSLDLPPEKDPKTGLWLEPKPIENQRKELPKAIITPKRLFTESYVKEMKILINEVLDEREGKFNYHSYLILKSFNIILMNQNQNINHL